MTNPTLHSTSNPSEAPISSPDRFVFGRLTEMLPQYRDSLELLFEQTANPHPFLHPDCLDAHFGRDSEDVQLAAVVHDGRLCCAGILDPWSLKAGQLPGTPLHWRLPGRRIFAKGLLSDGRGESVHSWLQHIKPLLQQHGWTGLLLEACAVDTPLWQCLDNHEHGLQRLPEGQLQPRWRVRLPATVDDYWQQQFKGKTRNTLRRKRKKLGQYRVEVIVEPEQIDDFLIAASAVSQHTWQSRELGLRVKNSEQERRLFRALARRRAFRGHLMLVDERPVAFVINTSHRGYLHFEETGFLPELSHLSPGTVLVSELIDDVISCGDYHTVDFGLGHADYKQLFSNMQTESSDLWLLRNSPVNTLATCLISADEALRSTAKRTLQRFGILGRLKKRRRGQ